MVGGRQSKLRGGKQIRLWQQQRFPPLSPSNETLWHEEPDTRFFVVRNYEFTYLRVAEAYTVPRLRRKNFSDPNSTPEDVGGKRGRKAWPEGVVSRR